MQLLFHKQFLKALYKLSIQDRKRARERLKLFVIQPLHPLLRNHSLKGSFIGFRSIDIKPDLRAIYKTESAETVRFFYLGSHSQLYK